MTPRKEIRSGEEKGKHLADQKVAFFHLCQFRLGYFFGAGWPSLLHLPPSWGRGWSAWGLFHDPIALDELPSQGSPSRKKHRWWGVARLLMASTLSLALLPNLGPKSVLLLGNSFCYDHTLAKLQKLAFDAARPLSFLLAELQAGRPVAADRGLQAVQTALCCVGNAFAHLSVERRKWVLQHLSKQLVKDLLLSLVWEGLKEGLNGFVNQRGLNVGTSWPRVPL